MLLLLAWLATPVLRAAPYTPADDAQVLERLPQRAGDPAARELAALRARWRSAPLDPATAVALARRLFEMAGEDGDPRHVGHAQAVLQPWWADAAPPLAVRVARAKILQYGHRFDDALADLQAAAAAEPDEPEAFAWIAAVRMVRAEYEAARAACARLADLAEPLVGVACVAAVDSHTGRAAAASRGLHEALRRGLAAEPAQRLWALTRLAEIDERRGAHAEAEAAYREALALGVPDVYLRAAYADFLLDRRRPAEVIALLAGGGTRADALLLRLAIAARAVGDTRAAGWARELQARFDASNARGDATHRKEEARFALEVLGQPQRALALARDNYAVQREVADARVLLEAALAAGQRASAEPVRQWMARSRIEAPSLAALVARLDTVK
jgi:tetratricopeptide (TPR) repeat protein